MENKCKNPHCRNGKLYAPTPHFFRTEIGDCPDCQPKPDETSERAFEITKKRDGIMTKEELLAKERRE